MTTNSYKNHLITESGTTTDTARGIKHVFEIADGPHSKRATARPFLTSVAACREYINREADYSASRAENSIESPEDGLLSNLPA